MKARGMQRDKVPLSQLLPAYRQAPIDCSNLRTLHGSLATGRDLWGNTMGGLFVLPSNKVDTSLRVSSWAGSCRILGEGEGTP